jgi:predicted nucleic acid-binding protein
LILVDTSAWIDFFGGSGVYADSVDELLETNEVALCGPVLTELRRGLRSDSECRKVLPLLDGCTLLEQPSDLWREAGELGAYLGRRGANVKSLDLLIAVYVLAYSLPLLTKDSDFALMQKAGVQLLLIKP